ncbi:Gfo/Idh/MocA family oxidoreductase [Dinoroseobacter sp. PD6]|uniref:Gfo/Idh/MocA family protein n=1 Tax=Dinoroseobacter sp. PD6 TaxID=3028384 RepID=UPI00237BCB48|nr:Gfo/Idh/MocA family oxidoreductase [Dinoroseobacter sp. PD6]MDD9717069.1 Gfo/Idh/MocA family oxidoreductase [Dinoroseobacter sp. PD6]
MTDTKTYGLIGAGMMGQEHLRNLALLPGAQATALFDPDDTMATAALALAPGAVRASSLAEMLAMPALDALVIASPNFRHMEQLAEIAATRPLPLLVEKPLYTDPADLPRLKALVAAYPAPIWVAMEYRYMPPIAAFLDQLQAATGGVRMLTIREHRFPFLAKVGDWNRFNRYTGGTFVEKCCHFFDLMRLALGAEPTRILASATPPLNHADECYDGARPDILDAGYAICEFDSGARAMLELCMYAEGARYQEELSAVGPAGKIEARVPGPGRFWPADLGAPPTPLLELSPRAPQRPELREIPVDPTLLAAGDHNGATFYQHRAFLDLLRGQRTTPEVTAEDGWRAVEMGLAAQRSIATGLPVSLVQDPVEISA